MDAMCGLGTQVDDTGMGDTWGDGSAKGGTRPMRALPRAGARLAGTLRGVAASWRAICLYLLAIVAWWALLKLVCGFPVTASVLLPQPGTRTMTAVPTIVLVVAGAVVGVLRLSRPARTWLPFLVPLTVTGPSAAAILTTNMVLDGPDEMTPSLPWVAALALAMAFCVFALRRTHPGRPWLALVETVIVLMFVSSVVSAAYPVAWHRFGLFWDYGGEPDVGLADQARRLEDEWDQSGTEDRAALCDGYLVLACRTLGPGTARPIALALGSGGTPRVEGDLPVLGLADLVSTREGAEMVTMLDDLASQVALSDRADDLLWVLSPDVEDPTVAEWARTKGVRYGEALGGKVDDGNEQTYREMAESLLSYVRGEGGSDAEIQA